MNLSYIVKYYSRKDIRKEMVRIAKKREFTGRRITGEFLQRPGILSYEQEVLDLARRGTSSFHMSEEIWMNPLQLTSEIRAKEMDDLRDGWDLVIDIDAKHIEFAKICAYLVEEFLSFYEIENYSIKFSGGKGFHIIVPFDSFPEKVNGKEVRKLFPEASRIIASFIQEQIKEHLKEKILEDMSIPKITELSGLSINTPEELNVLNLVNLDPIAISPRHMIRMPYSFNEKTGLVSIPIEHKSTFNFNIENAKPEKVVVVKDFMALSRENEAENLFIQAYDFFFKPKKEEVKKRTNFTQPKGKIAKNFFPPCINSILQGREDGRKRALFILINFLKMMKWDWEDVVNEVNDWNKRNKEPLRQAYVNSQLHYYKGKVEYMIPNCDSQNFYKDLAICSPDNVCRKIKNPINYAYKRGRISK